MLDRLPRLWRNVALVVLAALTIWFAWSIRAVLNPLIVGYLLAYVLHPLVQKVERRGFRRRTAVNLVFLGCFLMLAALVLGVFVQGRKLVRETVLDPEVQAKVTAEFQELREVLPPAALEVVDGLDFDAVVDWLRGLLVEPGVEGKAVAGAGVAAAGSFLGFLSALIGSTFAAIGFVVLVPIYCWYLLFELDRIRSFVVSFVPVGERPRSGRVAHQIGEVLASFFRGRMVVCLLKGAFLTVGLLALDVPYAFLFGMGSGLLSIVPFFGPMIGFVVAFVVAVLDHGLLGSLWRTGVVFGLAEVVEGYVLVPRIMGDSLGLHPVVVLFALLAGGAALGMFGVLIALPLTAAVVIVAREYVLPVLRQMAEDGPVLRTRDEASPRPDDAARLRRR